MTVKIYTTEFCPWCMKSKEFFSRHKIKYKEIDVGNNTRSAAEMIKKSGQQGVPVIEVNGKMVIGFNENKLKPLLKIKPT